MAINVAAVEQQVLAAIKAAAGGAAPASQATLVQLAQDLTAALAAIEADNAAGTITPAQAQSLIQATVDGAKAALVGLAAPIAQAILSAGLNTLITVAATATGLGWAVPIIQAVVNGL